MDDEQIEKIIGDMLRNSQKDLEFSLFSNLSTASSIEPKPFNYEEFLNLLKQYPTKDIIKAVIISKLYSPETGAYKKQGDDGIYFIVSPSVWKSMEPMFVVPTETGIWESLCGVPVYEDEQMAYDIMEYGYFKTSRDKTFKEYMDFLIRSKLYLEWTKKNPPITTTGS